MQPSNVFMSIPKPDSETSQWRWADLYTSDAIDRNGALDLVLWTVLPPAVREKQDNCEICFSPLCETDRPTNLYPPAASFAYRNVQELTAPDSDVPEFVCATENAATKDRRVEVFHTGCLLSQVVRSTADRNPLKCVVLNRELQGTLFVALLGEEELLELLSDDLDLANSYQDAMLRKSNGKGSEWKLATTALFDQANELARIYWTSGRGPKTRLAELRKALLGNSVWPLVNLVTFGSVEQIETQLNAEQQRHPDDWRLIDVAVKRDNERILLAVVQYARQTIRNNVAAFDEQALANVIEKGWFSVVREIVSLNDSMLFTVVSGLSLSALVELIKQPLLDPSTRALFLTGYLKQNSRLNSAEAARLIGQLSQVDIDAIPVGSLQTLLFHADEGLIRSLATNHARWFIALDQEQLQGLLVWVLRVNADPFAVRGFDSLVELGLLLGEAVKSDNQQLLVYLLQTRKYRYRESDLERALYYTIEHRTEPDDFRAVQLVLNRIDRSEILLQVLLDASLEEEERAYLEGWVRTQEEPKQFNALQLAVYRGDIFSVQQYLTAPYIPADTVQQLLMLAAIIAPTDKAGDLVDVFLADSRRIVNMRWPLIYDNLLSRLVSIPSRLPVLRQLLADRRNAVTGEPFRIAFDVALANERQLAIIALIDDARFPYEVHFEQEHYTDAEFTEFEEYVDVTLADFEWIEPIGRSVRALIAASDEAGLLALATHSELLNGNDGGLLEFGFHLLDGDQLQPVQIAVLKEPVMFPVLIRLYVDASNERMRERVETILVALFATGEELDTPPEEELRYFLVHLIRNGPVALLRVVRPLFSDQFVSDVLDDWHLFANGYDAEAMLFLRPNTQ